MQFNRIQKLKNNIEHAKTLRELIGIDFKKFKTNNENISLCKILRKKYSEAILKEAKLILELTNLIKLDFKLYRATRI